MSSNPWLNKNKPSTGVWANQDVRRFQSNQQANRQSGDARSQQSNQPINQSRPQQQNQPLNQSRPQQSNQSAWNNDRNQQSNQSAWNDNRNQQSNQQNNQSRPQQSAWNDNRPQQSNQSAWNDNRNQQSNQQNNQSRPQQSNQSAWNDNKPQQSAWNNDRNQQNNQSRPQQSAWNNDRNQQSNQLSKQQLNQNRQQLDQNVENENPIRSNLGIKRLNRKILMKIFSYLPTEDLSRLNMVCKRFYNTVHSLVEDLQVLLEFDEDQPHMSHLVPIEFRPVILRYTSPSDFVHHWKNSTTPFPLIKRLYLSYDDDEGEEILNLTKFRQLKYLKIRGANIKLSVNRLRTVTHIDIDDPNCCEKQVFRNLKNFHLEADIENLRREWNTSRFVTAEFIFTKSFDILLDKNRLEQVSFTVHFSILDLISLEKFVDALDKFLKDYEEEINKGPVRMVFKHTNKYDEAEKEHIGDERRWNSVWNHLKYELKNRYQFFSIDVRKINTETGESDDDN